MKCSIKKFLVVSTLIASFVTAQGVWAKEDLDCGTFVSGVVCEINYELNAIEVCATCPDQDCSTVYGIPLAYIEKWDLAIDLDNLVDMEVDINAHECPLTGKLMACDLTTGGEDFEFRQGALGKNGDYRE